MKDMVNLVFDMMLFLVATGLLAYVIYCWFQARWMRDRIIAAAERIIRDFSEDYHSWVQVCKQAAYSAAYASMGITAILAFYYGVIRSGSFYGHLPLKTEMIIMVLCAAAALLFTALDLLHAGRDVKEEKLLNAIYRYVQRFDFKLDEHRICMELIMDLLDTTPEGVVDKYVEMASGEEEQAGRAIVTDLMNTTVMRLGGGDTIKVVLANGKTRELRFDSRAIRYLKRMQQGANW